MQDDYGPDIGTRRGLLGVVAAATAVIAVVVTSVVADRLDDLVQGMNIELPPMATALLRYADAVDVLPSFWLTHAWVLVATILWVPTWALVLAVPDAWIRRVPLVVGAGVVADAQLVVCSVAFYLAFWP